MPAFLLEYLRSLIYVRIKDRIQIHIHEILKILVIAACNRINRLIWISHRVKKCIQRSFGKFHERILRRILLGSAQYGMLHDMLNTRTVLGRSPEAYIENLVIIIICDKAYSCTGFLMTQNTAVRLKIFKPLFTDHFI